MADAEDSKGFQVRDRRRFTETGEARPNEETEESPPEPPPSSRGPSAEAPASGPPPPSRGTSSGPVTITLSTFLVSLSTQVLMLLGEIPNPVTGEPEAPDLDGASELISVITMLQEKTRGNLDESETKLIQQILYDLRMRYVSRAQGR